MLKKLLTLFSFITWFLMNTGHCMIEEEVDFNGAAMVHSFGHRIADDRIAKKCPKHTTTVSWLCEELGDEDYKDVKFLNLSNNLIADEGVEKIADFFNSGHLPSLKELNLSGNRITEMGVMSFASLLKRKNFKYLIIYGNDGAASQEGIGNLVSKLMEDLIEDKDTEVKKSVKKYLAKIIWIPESLLSSAAKKGRICEYHMEAHKKYYQSK